MGHNPSVGETRTHASLELPWQSLDQIRACEDHYTRQVTAN